MSDTTRWLLGISKLAPGQPGVEFGFEHPLPAWLWALVALAAAILGVLAYRRLEGPLWARAGLALVRSLLLLALAVIISGPRLIKPNETEEKDWVLVLVDRSASLSVPDAPGAGSIAQRQTRQQQLQQALNDAAGTFKSLATERVVVWLGFDGSAYELDAPRAGQGVPTLTDPVGRRTDIDRAIDQALQRAAARPISGVVLITDGRSVSEPSKQLIRRLDSEKVPAFSVALGNPDAAADVAIRRTEAPRSAFVGDLVPVQVELERTPSADARIPADAAGSIVELVDVATGTVLDSQEVDWLEQYETAPSAGQSQNKRITLTSKSGGAGKSLWNVRVRPKAGGSDMIAENNSAEFDVELVDRPLRVAYFDGYPRWEYRYLKSLLVREQSISSAVMLLAPGRRYLQEGTVVLDALPLTIDQWKPFDLIIMGDVLPSVFTNDQLEQIKQRVSVGGAGLLWIGGDAATPALWRGTPLADLLPFSPGEGPGGSGSVDAYEGAIVVRPTPTANRLGVLRLSDNEQNGAYWPVSLSDPATGWSQLYWAQRIDPRSLKPTAEVLATASRGDDSTAPATPLVLSMRFGAGRSVYVATDEIWRWRYGRGEMLPERFWLQIIRLLGRDSLARSGRPAIIEASPQRAQTNQPVRVAVTLLDQALVDSAPQSITVRVRPAGGQPELGESELTLAPEGGSDIGAGVKSKPGSTRTYSATFISGQAGRFVAEAPDPLLSNAAAALATGLEVWLPDDELREPQADHALLQRLSQTSGGKLLNTNQLDQLPKLLPNRRLRLAGEPDTDTLWDTPLALMVVMTLLAMEWIGRRLLRLA